jgi:hypothetical protein
MRALTGAVGLILTFGSSFACTSSTQNVTGPSTSKCQVTAVAEPASFGVGGGAATLTVTANRECPWSASSSDQWIRLADEPSGQGNAKVAFSVTTNPDPSQRRGSIMISGQALAISQEAAPCVFTVPPRDTVSPDGERRTINVTASNAECSWTARSETDWLAILQGSQGKGSGPVVYEAQLTRGPSRNGELTIAGQRVSVTQGGGCQFSISPESYSAASAGGAGAVAVTTDAGCDWTANSNAPWITITSGGSGRGNGTVHFNVASSNVPPRSGTLAIAGRTFTVSQSSGCSVGISPTSQTVPAGGGSFSVAVSAGAGCTWTAIASASGWWARITGGQNGSGAGTVTFTVDPTPSSFPRSTTLSIAGQTFAVTQDGAPCSHVLSPSSVGLAASGGSGSFEVNTPEGCTWSAASNDAWLHVTAGASGSGDGTVSFSADANPGSARTGTIAAGGRTFTASQAAAGALTLR